FRSIVADTGDVYAYGDAMFAGGVTAAQLLSKEKVTSLSPTPTGKGYWIFTSRGRVFPFGDAQVFGDMAKVALNGPVKSSIATPRARAITWSPPTAACSPSVTPSSSAPWATSSSTSRSSRWCPPGTGRATG